ncbi:MAG: hypothetical protein JWP57_4670 [Spirosoma sp.]|nr:hypothetical protein [Spirosoma sp.]
MLTTPPRSKRRYLAFAPEISFTRPLTLLAWVMLASVFGHSLYVFLGWLNDPLLDQHSFRQTQTALSVYWISQGGPILAYETPVLGSPWSIPFEAPVYHLPVAILVVLGVPLDAAGRMVSFIFLLGASWPLRMLWRDLAFPPVAYPMACALLLASPLYLFWGRSFLIESCAWFLALLWLAMFARFLTSKYWAYAVAAMLIGSLASLAKVTTFPAFALVGGIIALPYVFRRLRQGRSLKALGLPLCGAAALVLPFSVGLIWVLFSDSLRGENPFGALLSAAALSGWNYGDLAQRISTNLWEDVVAKRMLRDIFGDLGIFALIPLLGAVLIWRSFLTVIVCIGAFLTPILIFTNLHLVHNYYQFANGAFLLVALAIALGTLPRIRFGNVLAGLILVVVVGSQLARFERRNMVWMVTGAAGNPAQQIGILARGMLPDDGSLFVLGEDWSSTVAYYARRRALALPYSAPQTLMEDVLRDPQSYLAGTRFAGVIDCIRAGSDYGSVMQPQVDAFLAGRLLLAKSGHCRLLSAEKDVEHH